MSPRYAPADWYDTPRYYDIVFDEDSKLEGTFLETMLERYGPRAGRSRGNAGSAKGTQPQRAVFEPACGSGRLLVEMARRGYRVCGLDLSAEMLAYARARLDAAGLEGRLVRAPMESFRLRERFDLAHCLVSSFKYLADERSAREHLRSVARTLRKGGIYVLGLHLTEYELDQTLRERWVGKRGKTTVVCNIQSWPPDRATRTERVRSRLTVDEPSGEKRIETSWTFRTYDAAQLRRLLRSVDELEHVTTFDFTYELDSERELTDDWLDSVLILRRR